MRICLERSDQITGPQPLAGKQVTHIPVRGHGLKSVFGRGRVSSAVPRCFLSKAASRANTTETCETSTRGCRFKAGAVLSCRRTAGSTSGLKYEHDPSTLLHPVCAYHSLPYVPRAACPSSGVATLVALATGCLVLVVPVDPARLNRFSRSVIAQRVRGRYSRLVQNDSGQPVSQSKTIWPTG